MRKVVHQAEIAAPADHCFAYVDRFENLPRIVFGLKSFDAVGPSDPRLGTQIAALAQLGPMKFTVGGHVCEYVENRLISVRLEDGLVTGRWTWRFSPTSASACTVTVEFSYCIAGGLAGRALAKVVDSVLEPGMKHTENQLREQVLATYRTVSGG